MRNDNVNWLYLFSSSPTVESIIYVYFKASVVQSNNHVNVTLTSRHVSHVNYELRKLQNNLICLGLLEDIGLHFHIAGV